MAIFIYYMGLTTEPTDGMPKYYNNQEIKDAIIHFNALCMQNQKGLSMRLVLEPSKINHNNKAWRNSLVPGSVLVFNGVKDEKFNIVLNLKGLYKAYSTLRHFEKKNSPQMVEIMTPSAIEENEELNCCICMEKAPSMMLPCLHEFCAKCMSAYILEKDEKKCPLCRTEFKVNTENLQRMIYEVIGEEDELEKELKPMMLAILKELNSRQVANMQKAMDRSTQIQQDFMPE